MIKNVIFDMDGTLTDTEKLYHAAWNKVSEKYHLDGAEEMLQTVSGMPTVKIGEIFSEKYGDDVNFDSFINERNKMFVESTKTYVPLKPYAKELLINLRSKGIKIALATSTLNDLAYRNLATAGILEYFDCIITGDMVEHGKPEPDIFLKAADGLSARPYECAVVEDSRNGVIGAYKAGMIPIMAVDLVVPDDTMFNTAKKICYSLKETEDYIENYNKGETEQ